MQAVWRIATEGRTYPATDMSGIGAAREGGRWNSPGNPMVYAAGSIALACLETLVHIKNSLPLNRYLVKVDIPQDLWQARQLLIGNSAPGWDAEPAGFTSIALGDSWIAARSSVIYQVPSVIIPEESNFLINPSHPDIDRITATAVRRWIYSPRLRSAN